MSWSKNCACMYIMNYWMDNFDILGLNHYAIVQNALMNYFTHPSISFTEYFKIRFPPLLCIILSLHQFNFNVCKYVTMSNARVVWSNQIKFISIYEQYIVLLQLCANSILTLFYSTQFGPFSVYYEAHIHYVSATVHKRKRCHKSYINGKSIDWSFRWDQFF